MRQITLRGVDQELERRLKEFARREGVSLNRAAQILLRRGAGLIDASAPATAIGDALDPFIGRWSKAEERRLLESIAACEVVDKNLWK